MFWAKEPDYRVLFSNISDEEGGAIVAQLSQLNIPYRIDTPGRDHGAASQVHEVRMKLAQQGCRRAAAWALNCSIRRSLASASSPSR